MISNSKKHQKKQKENKSDNGSAPKSPDRAIDILISDMVEIKMKTKEKLEKWDCRVFIFTLSTNFLLLIANLIIEGNY